MTQTVIIGAGVAGLATAALLAREGHQVTVLEKNHRVGGRTGLLEREGFRFDTGPSWYLMPEVFDHFFQMLGTSTHQQLQLSHLQPGYRVFGQPAPDGKHREPFTVEPGRTQVADAFEQRETGSASQLNRYLDSAQRACELAQRYFLYNPFTRPHALLHPSVVSQLPQLAPLLFTSLETHIAQRFSDPLLRQVLGYPAVFLGTTPAKAPALYHLMSAFDLDQGVQYPLGGFWTIIERLQELATAAGATIITNATVQRIYTQPVGKRWLPRRRTRQVNAVLWREDNGTEHHQQADIVVSAADLHHTETQLLDPCEQSYPPQWWKRRNSGPGAVIALLGVRGTLPQLPHHSLFFTRDWQTNFAAIFGQNPHIPDPASMYVCKPSATDPSVAPEGHENLFLLMPVPADPQLGGGGAEGTGSPLIEKAVDAGIKQMSQWAKIADLPQRIVVRHTLGPADFAADYFSWKAGMLGPGHTLGQSAMLRAQNASKKVAGLYYAGATTAPGIGVPMCLISAQLVLKRIRGDHSPGPLALPPPPVVL